MLFRSRRALAQGGLYPAALNAANEVAVGAFIAGEIGFLDIMQLAGRVLDESLPTPTSVEDVFAIDAQVREQTRVAINSMK